MRRIAFILLLLVAVVLELQHLDGRRSHRVAQPVSTESVAQARAEHLLTLLDFWNQELMPYVLLQRNRQHELQIGDLANAARLERRLDPGLVRVQRLWADAADDPLLRANVSSEARALSAAREAWTEWASAVLRRRPPPAGRIASLEANAVQLDQAAYKAIDASLVAAVE